jgi:hypothetical protein
MLLDPEDSDPGDFDQPEIIEPDENGEYACPVCGDYTGKRTSVEAHITGKSDEQHKGQVGKDYRQAGPKNEPVLVDRPVGEPKPLSMGDSRSDSDTSDDDDPEDVPGIRQIIGAVDGSFAGMTAVALIVLAWWIAQKSDNEDAVESAWDNV